MSRLDVVRDLLERHGPRSFVDDLTAADLAHLGWSGDQLHVASVARQLERVGSGDVVYLVVRVDGVPYSKVGVDFTKDAESGTIWQVASHPALRGLSMAAALLDVAEDRIVGRRREVARLSVELDNGAARRLYARSGYHQTGVGTESWPVEGHGGRRRIHTVDVATMEKALPRPAGRT